MNIQHGIVDIISPHVTALMQVLTNDFPQYNMRLITTKCLNTGIMITFSLLGQKGLHMVDQCDSNLTTQRHKSGIDNNAQILKQLRNQLASKRERRSKLYYILLSDGYFPQDNQTNKYFPGHVVIVEKHFDQVTQQHFFRFHQSYINKYNFKQYNSIVNKVITLENVNNILDGLEKVMTSNVWKKSNVKIWSKLTNVDTTDFLNTVSKNRFFLCFRKAEINRCVSSLRKYIKGKLAEMQMITNKQPDATYGNTSMYLNPDSALTNKQVIQELQELLNKIEQHERICFKHNNE
jgi:hypothetical protein